MAKKLTSLFASMMLFISNGAQAKPKNFEQSLKIENNKNVGNSLKIDNNISKKINDSLTTEDFITYLCATLFLGGGLYYGVPYCRELYKKYAPVKPLNKEQPTLKTNTVFIANQKIQDQKKNICSNFKHKENEYEKFKNFEEKNKDPKKNICSNFKHKENEYEKFKNFEEKNKDLKNNIKLNSKYEKSGDKSLGEGAQGEAWLFKNLETGELVVVKTIKDEDAQKCEKLAYENREMLSDCEYFCKPLDYFEEDGVAYAVYEYIDGIGITGLSEIIKQGKNESLLISELFCQLFEAVKYLKDKGFSHNDLLKKNILFIQNDKKELRIKIVDYGAFKKGFDDKIKDECSVCYLIFSLTCEIDELLNRNDDPWPKVVPDFVNFMSGQNLNEKSFKEISDFFGLGKQEKIYKQISNKSHDEVINFFKNEMKKVDK